MLAVQSSRNGVRNFYVVARVTIFALQYVLGLRVNEPIQQEAQAGLAAGCSKTISLPQMS